MKNIFFLFLFSQLQQVSLKFSMYGSRLKMSGITFSQHSSGQFDPREYTNQYATERDIQVWKQIFDIYDTDQDGVLAPRDLLEAMSKYKGYHPRRNCIYRTMAFYDKDESGNIDFKEFIRMIFEKPYEKDTTEDIKKVFHEIDYDLKGHLDTDDLKNLAAELKEEFTQEDINIIMKKLDPKRTGKISVEAFLEFNREKIY